VAGCVAFGAATVPVDPLVRSARHTYLGYALKVSGRVGSEAREFLVGVGPGAHTKHHFRAGNAVSGDALPVPDPQFETVEFYKVSNLEVGLPEAQDEEPPSPWRGVPPPLAVYRERGHRRVAARTFQEKCWRCIWGCRMRVEIIIDHWIRVGATTEARPSVTVLVLARSTKPDRPARFPAAAVE
jgi:hypothetical protein